MSNKLYKVAFIIICIVITTYGVVQTLNLSVASKADSEILYIHSLKCVVSLKHKNSQLNYSIAFDYCKDFVVLSSNSFIDNLIDNEYIEGVSREQRRKIKTIVMEMLRKDAELILSYSNNIPKLTYDYLSSDNSNIDQENELFIFYKENNNSSEVLRRISKLLKIEKA